MFPKQLIKKFQYIETPFYFYDVDLLKKTLQKVKASSERYGYKVHYALKANANDKILQIIQQHGLGADCVSGNEVKKAVEQNFSTEKIVFAGVGKSDKEINYALEQNIFCFNCESIQEIEVINELVGKLESKSKMENVKGKTEDVKKANTSSISHLPSSISKKVARLALRINPNVQAHTHHYITTGLEENKFGINLWELENVLAVLKKSKNVELLGLHFHVGSQITDMSVFKNLCLRVNEICKWFAQRHIFIQHLNMGGGLGVDYHHPEKHAVTDFEEYFKIFHQFLEIQPTQKVHFELGRAIVAQCGSLIGRVLYVKKGVHTDFVILDAGMTELIRPALYQSYHKIENISTMENIKLRIKSEINNPKSEIRKYDVVGPICESSDCFGKAVMLTETKRGDLFAIKTTGAYGEVMSSEYNLREKAKAIYSDEV